MFNSKIPRVCSVLLLLACLLPGILTTPSGSVRAGMTSVSSSKANGDPFELRENNFSDGSPKNDVNGFLLNPQWSGQQVADPPYPDPSNTQQCPRPDFSDCAGRDKPVIDKADLCTIFNCGISTIKSGHSLWTRAPGHVNWKTATYTGRICFNDYSYDFDWTLNLITKGRAGLTLLNSPNEKNVGVEPVAMHTEFDARETVNNFVTDYWKNLVEKVGDRTQLDCTAQPKDYPCAEINNDRAIEIGLVGLDTGHEGYSELHPVYALAVETAKADDASSSTWIMFARNRGDEGDCSGNDHPLTCNDSKPAGTLRLFIPAPLRKHATGARLLEGTQLASNFGSGSNCPTFTFGHYGNDDGLLIETKLPSGTYPLPEDGPLLEGVLRIAWNVVGDAATSDWTDLSPLPECGAVPIIKEQERMIEPINAAIQENVNKTEKKRSPLDSRTPLTPMTCVLSVLNPTDPTHPPKFEPGTLCEGRAINLKSPAIKEFHRNLGKEITGR